VAFVEVDKPVCPVVALVVVLGILAFAEEKIVAEAFARNEVPFVEVAPGIVVLVAPERLASALAAWDHAVLSWAEPVYPLIFLSF
jgi:hypothetical protein